MYIYTRTVLQKTNQQHLAGWFLEKDEFDDVSIRPDAQCRGLDAKTPQYPGSGRVCDGPWLRDAVSVGWRWGGRDAEAN